MTQIYNLKRIGYSFVFKREIYQCHIKTPNHSNKNILEILKTKYKNITILKITTIKNYKNVNHIKFYVDV